MADGPRPVAEWGRGGERGAGVGGGDGGRAVERAIGLLAGRARCRTAEAHRHLLRLAAERRCDVAELAHQVIRLLDSAEATADRPPSSETVSQLVADAMASPAPGHAAAVAGSAPGNAVAVAGCAPGNAAVTGFVPRNAAGFVSGAAAAMTDGGRPRAAVGGVGAAVAGGGGSESARPPADGGMGRGATTADGDGPGNPGERPDASWLATVQNVLDTLPGMSGYLVAELDQGGRLTDLVWAAASPDAVTADGLRGTQLIGLPVSRLHPEVIGGDRWVTYQRVLDSGEPAEVGPVRLGDGEFTIRAGRLGPGLLISWEPAQLAGAERLAEVERTLAAEHELAARLQRIILPIPEEPIDLPGVRVAVRYLPAAKEATIGGDWYHAAALRDGSVLLAVGDVAGHGTQAATTMAQLRHALRALAVVTSDPGTLLGHLNRLICELEGDDPELVATAVVARFDPGRGELVWAQAGHPPPLMSRGGRTVPLPRPAGPMLGVVDGARYADAVVGFTPGDVLLLYTDGLVEQRNLGPDVGLDSVIATVDEAVRAAPEQPLAEMLARLRRANPDDDTCILAARPRR